MSDEYLDEKKDQDDFPEPLFYNPESIDEGARKSGLAYGAGITLFGFVAVMTLIGLGIDAYFRSAPWGLVIGVLIGAALGFYQFFRITSQIIK
jgi:F0F1-type ATP synthase assembly protein I